ncbi:hypothetical protein P4U43_07320 [Arthrobacter sp. EH-1B-1]|uniref:HIRAN domain-containing protein n=1 Tax=Arthrobacter vasquezii TaxID=2977629 RepID=A0ABT6CU65_9MICC|nr:hypothetical protein [Arthrobacter vasquezii]MDF9277596.1 hypothetical protein [Arthrobacter vasquezii]
MVESNYTPPPREYIRPGGRYMIELGGASTFDNHFVRGAFFHGSVLADYRRRTSITVELVPEPGNPHDPWAVAFHVEGRRIGYMASAFAAGVHEYVAGHNRLGRAVQARGEVRVHPETDARSAIVFLPWWRNQDRFHRDSGIPAECNALIDDLPAEIQLRAMQTSQDLAKIDVRAIRSREHLAPGLVWSKRRGVQIPFALRQQLIFRDKERKEEARQQRIAATKDAERAKLLKMAREAEEKRDLERSITELASQGLPKTAIARALKCSEHQVRSLLRARGIPAPDANEISRSARLNRCHQALALQQDGLTRNEIAQFMGCSFETVKGMLKDAKFFEHPSSDPQRLERAQAVKVAANVVKLADAAAILAWTTKAVKDARSDAATLQSFPVKGQARCAFDVNEPRIEHTVI